MSFLNPTSETVLQFSSTDTSAPQINHSARAAGDIKTILKACLVTGYGSKQSAGWTIQNETTTVAEFVSPSVAMSDYRIGVDDSSASQTQYYYTYQNIKTTPEAALTKSFSYIDKASPNNGWVMLVTKLGILFIEYVYHSYVKAKVARVVCMGQIKHALQNDMGKNFTYWTWGMNTPGYIFNVMSDTHHLQLADTTQTVFNTANRQLFNPQYLPRNACTIEIHSGIYFSWNGLLQGEQPGVMIKTCNDSSKLFGVNTITFENRPALYVCLGYSGASDVNSVDKYSIGMLVFLDKWDY